MTGISQTPANAKPRIIQVKACEKIGNIYGNKPLNCRGEGGRGYGKAGRAFRPKKPIWLLVRFRELPTRKHTVRVRTCPRGTRGGRGCKNQRINFKNT